MDSNDVFTSFDWFKLTLKDAGATIGVDAPVARTNIEIFPINSESFLARSCKNSEQKNQRKRFSAMTIPVVQGTAVPSGGGDTRYQAPETPYMATATSAAAPDSYATSSFKGEVQPVQYRDFIWAVAFWLHLAVMIFAIVTNIASMRPNDDQQGGGYSGIIWLVGVTAIASIALSSAALNLMMRFATELIKAALIFTVFLSLLIAVLGLMSGQVLMGCIGLFMFAVGICYARAVWHRIPFAAANLNTALAAVKDNMGLTVVAYVFLIIAMVWSALWFIGLGESISAANQAVLFFLLLSYYWVHQVLTNTVHVTTAGTVGTWWLVPAEANSFFSTALTDSFYRATTYSFGSICLGSLLVAVVQSLRALARMARDNDDGQLLACIIECILACIQDIIEYFNQWAYVYVGLYGYGYIEAGRNVIQLFQHKGWTVVISDNLCDRALLMVSLGVGFLTGLVGMLLAGADQSLLVTLDLGENNATAGFV